MGIGTSLFIVIGLVVLAFIGVKIAKLYFIFGIVIPYLAVLIFIVGFIYRVLKWASSPVPFHIPTTCGQQRSLPWIKHSRLESPANSLEVIARMVLEILLFRSLFRNIKAELKEGRLAYGSTKWLWLGALLFHMSFFVVFVRHLRFFTYPVLTILSKIDSLDGFLQVGAPHLLISGVVLLGAVVYLLLRRLFIPQVRYISLPADYFPLFLIMGIAISGILMRYFYKVDIVRVKELTMSLVSLQPVVPEGIGVVFFIHLFLVSILFAYFPFSKLMHMAGVLLSPTRNLANNSRMKRHVNPWNYPVKVHTYEEYENEFREKMKMVDIPVEKE